MFSTGANYAKLKTNLRLAIGRLKLLQKKKAELALKARREIADYIKNGKYERAKIRVEHIIREDYLVEAMEMIEMYCDLLLARFGLIQQMKVMDEGMAEPISTIIWATPRLQTDIPEMKVISDQLTYKYGKPYTQSILMNAVDTMNRKLMRKLGVQAPSKVLVENYMIEIAKSNNLEYEPDPDIMREGPIEATLVDFDDDKPPGPYGGDNIGGGGFVYPQAGVPGTNSQPFEYPPPPPGLCPIDSASPPPYSQIPPTGHNAEPVKYQPPPDVMYPFLPPSNAMLEKPPMKPPRQDANNNAPQNTNNPSNDPFPELPSVPTVASAPEESVDLDYLTKRFEELKKRPI